MHSKKGENWFSWKQDNSLCNKIPEYAFLKYDWMKPKLTVPLWSAFGYKHRWTALSWASHPSEKKRKHLSSHDTIYFLVAQFCLCVCAASFERPHYFFFWQSLNSILFRVVMSLRNAKNKEKNQYWNKNSGTQNVTEVEQSVDTAPWRPVYVQRGESTLDALIAGSIIASVHRRLNSDASGDPPRICTAGKFPRFFPLRSKRIPFTRRTQTVTVVFILLFCISFHHWHTSSCSSSSVRCPWISSAHDCTWEAAGCLKTEKKREKRKENAGEALTCRRFPNSVSQFWSFAVLFVKVFDLERVVSPM